MCLLDSTLWLESILLKETMFTNCLKTLPKENSQSQKNSREAFAHCWEECSTRTQLTGSLCNKSRLIGQWNYYFLKHFVMDLVLWRNFCSWVISKPPRSLEVIPIPALRGDERHTMTTLQYLMELHYSDEEEIENSSSRMDSCRLGQPININFHHFKPMFLDDNYNSNSFSFAETECEELERRDSRNSSLTEEKKKHKARWRPMPCVNVSKFSSCKQSWLQKLFWVKILSQLISTSLSILQC